MTTTDRPRPQCHQPLRPLHRLTGSRSRTVDILIPLLNYPGHPPPSPHYRHWSLYVSSRVLGLPVTHTTEHIPWSETSNFFLPHAGTRGSDLVVYPLSDRDPPPSLPVLFLGSCNYVPGTPDLGEVGVQRVQRRTISSLLSSVLKPTPVGQVQGLLKPISRTNPGNHHHYPRSTGDTRSGPRVRTRLKLGTRIPSVRVPHCLDRVERISPHISVSDLSGSPSVEPTSPPRPNSRSVGSPGSLGLGDSPTCTVPPPSHPATRK